jgi:hypothetical protein
MAFGYRYMDVDYQKGPCSRACSPAALWPPCGCVRMRAGRSLSVA